MKRIAFFLVLTALMPGGCCDEDFIMPRDYDFFDYAIDLTDSIDTGCSEAIYTTVGATPDKIVGSCNPNSSSLHNRWFKFNASYSFIAVTVNGGNSGTQLHTYLTLWEANGTTELACSPPYFDDPIVYLSYGSLTVGEWYYISVDVEDAQSAGTFTMCLATD